MQDYIIDTDVTIAFAIKYGGKKILDEEEVKKIGKGLEKLNKGAIVATNSSLFIKIMLKVAVFNLLALIF